MSVLTPPPPPLLVRWNCGCVSLPLDANSWGVVVWSCERDAVREPLWRECLRGVEKVLSQEESTRLWEGIELIGADDAAAIRAAGDMREAILRLVPAR